MAAARRVHLVDGPAKREIRYADPLPKTLVVATKTPLRFHDYTRLGDGGQAVYHHSPQCPTCRET